MKVSLEKRIQYERLANGADTYILKTDSHGLVVMEISLPGCFYTMGNQGALLLLEDLLPVGFGKKKKSAFLEALEDIGAYVNISCGLSYLTISVTVRKVACEAALKLIAAMLVQPVFEDREWGITQERVTASLKHMEEDTSVQAEIELRRRLFKKGHPHWRQGLSGIKREIAQLSKKEVEQFFSETVTGTGSIVSVAGDFVPKEVKKILQDTIGTLPARVVRGQRRYDSTKIQNGKPAHIVISIPEKTNVDTVFGMPLFITYDHSDFLALSAAVHILGSNTYSRLFHTLRTKQSLTYYSGALLSDFSVSYPGYLKGMAIFPSAIFQKGRDAMLRVVRTFCERGVTAMELREFKEEATGTFLVSLSSTAGLCNVMHETLKKGKPLKYLDEYSERIDGLMHRDVQHAIRAHLDYCLITTVGAGSIDVQGNPL